MFFLRIAHVVEARVVKWPFLRLRRWFDLFRVLLLHEFVEVGDGLVVRSFVGLANSWIVILLDDGVAELVPLRPGI